MAAPRVERDQQVKRLAVIALLDADGVAESFQYPGPAERCHAVAVSRSWRRRSNDADFQLGRQALVFNYGSRGQLGCANYGQTDYFLALIIDNEPIVRQLTMI